MATPEEAAEKFNIFLPPKYAPENILKALGEYCRIYMQKHNIVVGEPTPSHKGNLTIVECDFVTCAAKIKLEGQRKHVTTTIYDVIIDYKQQYS